MRTRAKLLRRKKVILETKDKYEAAIAHLDAAMAKKNELVVKDLPDAF